ncbi:PA14 domain-containing protein [Streptomyces huiliensis]|uniref:PA14 domain-containing protein n=1 Tax=Streptomyces huiliensis TaxID=2876027 RepID=UPI001CC02CE3|nr:PA14 domain-containing protein [Streptomyces huiliensis]MBZ4317968.1 cellulose 1,4-beta-cellobiosidase [Streptomyces huiliensis]
MLRRTARRTSVTALALSSVALGLTVPAATAHAAPATTCAPGVWKAEFFPNTTFRGAPKKTTCDDAIAENYGTGAPAGTGLPRDGFGVRWTTTRDFGSGGPFTFTAEAADGIRVYLDDKIKVDLWKDVPKTQKKAVRVAVPKGKHTLRVNYAAFTGPANVKFTYTPVTGKTDDKVKPLAPAGLKAAFDAPSGKATLRWARNNELDLAGYTVHRRVLPAHGKPGAWTVASGKKPLTATSFTDRPKANGDGYAYAVTAVDKTGNDSGRSAEARITTPPPAPTTPTAPARLKVSADGLQAKLTWAKNTEPDLDGYKVWRRHDGADWTLVATTRENAAADAPWSDGTAYEYAVSAFTTHGKESPRSAPVSFRSAHHRPQPPTGLKAADVRGTGILLSWQSPDRTATSFHVYARDLRDGPDAGFRLIGSVKGTSFLDQKIRTVTTRFYYVRAVNAENRESLPSGTVRATH